MNETDARFAGIQRLYSAAGLERLRRAHVCVVGIGGVGSWAVEALARSGIGKLTLVDLDDVCVSNINRQLPAMDSVVGQPKVAVIGRRIHDINPDCEARALAEFFTAESADDILAPRYNYVFDAIDQVANKCLLIAKCRQAEIPIVSSGGAGGRKNPALIQISDLALTAGDALLQRVRKTLRDQYGFPRGTKEVFNVPCVYSTEPAVQIEGECALAGGCDTAYGTASFVTGAFGFAAAAHIVTTLAHG